MCQWNSNFVVRFTPVQTRVNHIHVYLHVAPIQPRKTSVEHFARLKHYFHWNDWFLCLLVLRRRKMMTSRTRISRNVRNNNDLLYYHIGGCLETCTICSIHLMGVTANLWVPERHCTPSRCNAQSLVRLHEQVGSRAYIS